MYKGDWQSARDAATAAKKWLLVNIQDAGEFQCQTLNRDVWSNEAVKTIIREHFLFWQVYYLIIFISRAKGINQSVKSPFGYNTRIYLSLAIQRKRRCAKIPNILPCN